MPLSTDRKKHFRSIGHNLKPIVTIAGNGLSDSVINELNRALEDHELIKVKLMIADRESRSTTIQTMGRQLNCEVIQQIGKVALLYRAAAKPNARLTNII